MYYDNRSFEELVNSDWPTQTIVASLERQLLLQIQGTHIAITRYLSGVAFMLGQLPQVASPAFTNNSEFMQRIQQIINSEKPSRASASP